MLILLRIGNVTFLKFYSRFDNSFYTFQYLAYNSVQIVYQTQNFNLLSFYYSLIAKFDCVDLHY